MAIYQTADQLYTCAQQLFDRIQQDDPNAARPLLASRLVIRFAITDLQGEIVLNGRTRPLQTTFGHNGTRPDLDIECTAATLHQILLGELAIAKALGRKQLKAKGPIFKATVLADLFRQGQTLYPKILQEQGLA
jgi:hypothetical protein